MDSAASNARWIALSQATRIGLQLASVVVLARLLTHADYGLLAMISVVTNFANLLRDMGTSAAVVQKAELSDEITDSVFWFNVLVGTVLMLALLLLAGPIAAAFRTPEVEPLLQLLAPVFLLTSLGAVHRALLERVSAFRSVVGIEIGNGVFSLVVTVAAAWMGAGAYSWVIGMLAAALLATLQFWRASRWVPGRPHLAGMRHIMRFSGNITGFNFINYFSRNADGFIVGRQLGAEPLGIYSSAYKIMLFPVQNMAWAANRALYPVMSRRQDDLPALASLYLRSLSVIAAVSAPLMTGVFVLREPFVLVMMGEKWLAVADVLKWLAPVGFVQSIASTTGPVFMVRDRTGLLLRLGALGAGLQVGAFLLGVHWGIAGVAVCYFAANLINAVPVLALALRQLDTRPSALLDVLQAPLLCSGLMAAFLALLRGIPAVATAGPLAELVFCTVAGAIVYGTLFFLLAPDKGRIVLSLMPGRRKGAR
ncbi:lipopolysaccharide biosynthesis protein [Caldimonas tepidiphila]|uniref:lipopolysaccharide biosynthesis protein n=1 Tax=Caldimonas tepidiphila TaxID=2315841 RepID=UPI000E5C2D4D|nr:lipopolysaccharide biosynthesis protein [Caldimonas tepidiphila]